MTRAAVVLLAVGLAACSSSRSKDDEPTTIPPPQPVSPSIDARLNDLQTSLTELLERLDVLNARIARLESLGGAPAPSPAIAMKTRSRHARLIMARVFITIQVTWLRVRQPSQ